MSENNSGKDAEQAEQSAAPSFESMDMDEARSVGGNSRSDQSTTSQGDRTPVECSSAATGRLDYSPQPSRALLLPGKSRVRSLSGGQSSTDSVWHRGYGRSRAPSLTVPSSSGISKKRSKSPLREKFEATLTAPKSSSFSKAKIEWLEKGFLDFTLRDSEDKKASSEPGEMDVDSKSSGDEIHV